MEVSLDNKSYMDSMGKKPVVIWNKKVPNTEMNKFKRVIEEKYHINFGSYWKFHKWSVENYADFWKEVWHYFGVLTSQSYDQVMVRTGKGILDVEWFSGAAFNFAENILRIRDNRVALICADELGHEETVTFAEMFEEVKLYASAFRRNGLAKGDRVGCYMPNVKEAVYAMLATTSIGAIWSGPLPYYGAQAAAAIFEQMKPKFLIAADYCQENRKSYDLLSNLPVIVASMPSLEKVIILPTRRETSSYDMSNIPNSVLLEEFLLTGMAIDGTVPNIVFEQLSFSHPISINFTSGTTGKPKGPVHSAGSFITVLKDFALHLNLKSGDVVFNCHPVGWSLWDYPIPSLALGITLFLYNGGFYYNTPIGNIWQLFSRHKVSFAFFATTVITMLEKLKIHRKPGCNLDNLTLIAMGGSPIKRQNVEFLHNNVKKDLFVGSHYGATEVSAAFSGFDLNTPSYAGEIQAPALGINIKCFDYEGNSVVAQRGELVICTPTPTLPFFVWNEDNAMLDKMYLSKFKGVWAQNDICYINPKTNGIVLIGRSDDILKQNGDRFSSGDIYLAIHQVKELRDYICVGQVGKFGDSRAVLFVKMEKGHFFTSQMKDKIAKTIEKELYDEYIPEVIVEIPDIPYNHNNKRMESIVRLIVATNKIPEVFNIKNPECLQYFINIPEVVNYSE